MNSEFAAHGLEARDTLQLELLENREMNDALSGLAYLQALPEVDAHRVVLVGHSFGGSLTLLMAEREPNLRAVVIFSGGAIAGIGQHSCEHGSLRPRRRSKCRYSSFMPQTITRSRRARPWTQDCSNSVNHTC